MSLTAPMMYTSSSTKTSSLFGCEHIHGSITSTGAVPSWVYQDELSCIRAVIGTLSLQNSPSTSLEPFDQLVHADNLYVDGSTTLTTIPGFASLAEVRQVLRVGSNPALSSLTSFPHLSTVGEVELRSSNLVTYSGLHGLLRANKIVVQDHTQLQSLNVSASGVVHMAGGADTYAITVKDNIRLASMVLMPNLVTTDGRILVDNVALVHLAIGTNMSKAGVVEVKNNGWLTSIDMLSAAASDASLLEIFCADNVGLLSWPALFALTKAKTLSLIRNGFKQCRWPHLVEVSELFQITGPSFGSGTESVDLPVLFTAKTVIINGGAGSVHNVTGLDIIETVNELRIQGVYIPRLLRLQFVTGYHGLALTVHRAANITGLCPELLQVIGHVRFEGSATGLFGFEKLSFINEWLTIYGQNLKHITPFAAVKTVKALVVRGTGFEHLHILPNVEGPPPKQNGALTLRDNSQLLSFSGYPTPSLTGIDIRGNPMLEVLTLRHSLSRDVTVYNNARLHTLAFPNANNLCQLVVFDNNALESIQLPSVSTFCTAPRIQVYNNPALRVLSMCRAGAIASSSSVFDLSNNPQLSCVAVTALAENMGTLNRLQASGCYAGPNQQVPCTVGLQAGVQVVDASNSSLVLQHVANTDLNRTTTAQGLFPIQLSSSAGVRLRLSIVVGFAVANQTALGPQSTMLLSTGGHTQACSLTNLTHRGAVSAPDTVVSALCGVPAGYGNRTLNLILNGVQFALPARLVYPPPVITPGTLRTAGATALGIQPYVLPSVLGGVVAVDGSFGTLTTQQVVADVTVTVGLPHAAHTSVCTVTQLSSTALHCLVPPGSGVGLVLRVTVGGKTVTGTDTLNYPEQPVVHNVTGCGSVGCPTEGGTRLTVSGQHFYRPLSVTVGGQACPLELYVSPLQIVCVLPPGSGLQQELVVSQGSGAKSDVYRLVNYQAPAVTALQGCQGGGNILSLHSWLPVIEDCDRLGGQWINISGRNFGPPASPASVLVGGTACQAVKAVNHSFLSCKLPPDGRQQLRVLVIPSGGQVSPAGQVALSYRGCPVGHSVVPACTPSPSHSCCAPCVGGSFSSLGVACENCDKGTYSEAAASFCSSCTVGKYQPVGGASACAACPVGRAVAVNRSTQCVACPPGKFASLNGSETCSECTPGFAAAAEGQSACTACVPGRVAANKGATVCDACTKGSFASAQNSTVCTPCTAGFIAALDGQSACTACVPGRTATDPSATVCDACTRGTFASAPNSTVCTPCAAGFIAALDGQPTCAPCQRGTFAPFNTSSVCLLCAPGLFAASRAAHACGPCTVGTVQPLSGQSFCELCDRGKFAALNASSTCLLCDKGKYSLPGAVACSTCRQDSVAPSQGQSSCVDCEVPTFARGQRTACVHCEGGKYAILQTTSEGATVFDYCDDCPLEADCQNGVVVSRGDTWVYRNNITGFAEVFSCVPGACGSNNLCKPGRRNPPSANPLCGECESEHSLWGGSCVPCTSVDWPRVILLALGTFVYVIVLHKIAQGNSSAPVNVALFFIQNAVLVVGDRVWAAWMAFLNFDLMDSSGGTCLFPVSQEQKMVYSLLTFPALLAWLLLIFVGHVVYARIQQWRKPSQAAAMRQSLEQTWAKETQKARRLGTRLRLPTLKEPGICAYPVRTAPYVRTALALFVFSYNATVAGVMHVLRCTRLPTGEARVHAYPAVDCDSAGWRSVRDVAVGMLVLFVAVIPLSLLALLYYHNRQHELTLPSFRRYFGGLSDVYRPRYWWWRIFSISRRTALVAVSVFLEGKRWELPLFAVLCLVFQVTHTKADPYRLRVVNHVETVSLMMLCALAAASNVAEQSLAADVVVASMALGTAGLLVLWVAYMKLPNVKRSYQHHLESRRTTAVFRPVGRQRTIQRLPVALEMAPTTVRSRPDLGTTAADDTPTGAAGEEESVSLRLANNKAGGVGGGNDIGLSSSVSFKPADHSSTSTMSMVDASSNPQRAGSPIPASDAVALIPSPKSSSAVTSPVSRTSTFAGRSRSPRSPRRQRTKRAAGGLRRTGTRRSGGTRRPPRATQEPLRRNLTSRDF